MGYTTNKKYEINYYDVDKNLDCKLSSIVNFLCDAGNVQAEGLGETIEALVANNYAWVFYKYDITIHKYPKYRDVVNVETEAAGFNKFYAFRKYRIKDENGNIFVEAIALFFLIDITRRRPKRISQEQIDLYSKGEELPKSVDMGEARELEEEQYSNHFNIRYSDIDSNGHVNNVNYITWAMEVVPTEIIEDYKLKHILVRFEKETTYGDKVKSVAQVIKENDNTITTLHKIYSGENVELTRIEIKWERE